MGHRRSSYEKEQLVSFLINDVAVRKPKQTSWEEHARGWHGGYHQTTSFRWKKLWQFPTILWNHSSTFVNFLNEKELNQDEKFDWIQLYLKNKLEGVEDFLRLCNASHRPMIFHFIFTAMTDVIGVAKIFLLCRNGYVTKKVYYSVANTTMCNSFLSFSLVINVLDFIESQLESGLKLYWHSQVTQVMVSNIRFHFFQIWQGKVFLDWRKMNSF